MAGKRSVVTIERCSSRRWTDRTTFRLDRRRRSHRLRIDTATGADYRLRVRSGKLQSRPAYLRVGRGERRVRKSVLELSRAERREYVEAVVRLKSTPSPYDTRFSYYDQFVAWHVFLSHCDHRDPLGDRTMRGHGGPVVWPWHRQFLLMFEDALRSVSGRDVTVPYWDWTDPASIGSVFADDFMGGDGDPDDGYAVKTGPFRRGTWKLVVQNFGLQWSQSQTSYITRRLGGITGIRLPTTADVRDALDAPQYDAAPFDETSNPQASFRNALEGFPPVPALLCGPDAAFVAATHPGTHKLHNAVHGWVGGSTGQPAPLKLGTMTVISASPNDPVFFLHHANLDRLWAQWQQTHGIESFQPEKGVPNNSVDDVLHPFDAAGVRATSRSVADIAQLAYRYTGLPAEMRAARDVTPGRNRAQLFCRLPA